MRSYFITFGCGDERSGSIVEVRADNREQANEKAFSVLGTRWAFMYDTVEGIHPEDRKYGVRETIE